MPPPRNIGVLAYHSLFNQYICQNPRYTLHLDYWTSKCGMTLYEQTEKSALLGFGEGQCRLELLDQGEPIDHKTAFGRVAFSCPREQVCGD